MGKIATTKTNEVQVFSDTTYMGAGDEIDSNDVQIPVIMLMQANSEIALDDSNDIKAGDFVHSLTQETLGSTEKTPLELVIVDMFKTQVWREGKNWIQTLNWDSSMEGEYDFEHENKPARKHKTFNYVVFDPTQVRTIALPDGDAYVAPPMIVRLKGSFAKKINTTLKDYASFGQPSWCYSYNLTSHQEKNDEGTYQQYEFKLTKKQSTKEVQIAAAQLCKTIREARAKGLVKTVEDEEREVSAEPVYQDIPVPTQEHVPNRAPGMSGVEI